MTDNHALRALRHHVTGAIERGEAQAIVARTEARCADCGGEFRMVPDVKGIPTPVNSAIRTRDNARICYACADKMARESMANPEVIEFGAYVSGDGKTLTTWTGGELAQVISEKRISGGGFHFGSLTSIRAKAPDGSIWHGRCAGRGMLIRIRRAKDTHR